MATVQDMFNVLIALESGKVLEVPDVDAQAAEYLRQQFSKKLRSYKEQLRMVGLPEDALPQSLKMKYVPDAGLALFSIGARSTRTKSFSFTIIGTSENEQALRSDS
jgi:hypothetical protein